MTASLQKHSPLYMQVRDRLLEQIQGGDIPPNGKLPSEHEICREFEVSRTTARLAVEDLIQQGLVIRLPGKGSFVRDEQPHEDIQLRTIGVITEMDVETEISKAAGCLLAAQGIQAALEPLGAHIVLVPAHNHQGGLTSDSAWDGLILISPPVALQKRFRNTSLPIVLIGNRHESIQFPCVAIHTFQMAFESVEYLFQLGHSRIAVIAGDLQNVGRRKMIQGYESAYLKHTYQWSKHWIMEADDDEDLEPKVRSLLEDGVTAIMAPCEYRISQVWDILNKQDLKVPEDISLFILEQDTSRLKRRPRYSGMYCDHVGLGKKAVEVLCEAVRSGRIEGKVQVEMPVLHEGITTSECKKQD